MQVQQQPNLNMGQSLRSTANETKANKTENVEVRSNTPDALQKEDRLKSTSTETTYMKVLSRVEHLIQEKKLEDHAIDTFTNAIDHRIQNLSEKEQKVLLALEEVKALEVENIEQLFSNIGKELKAEETPEKALALLKHPKFVELMNPEKSPKTYSPQEIKGSSVPTQTTVESHQGDAEKVSSNSINTTGAESMVEEVGSNQNKTNSIPQAYTKSAPPDDAGSNSTKITT